MKVLPYILITLLGAATIFLWLDRPKVAFVSNQGLFEAFEGKKELSERLDQLQKRHQHVLDSVRLVLQNSDQAEQDIIAKQAAFYRNIEAEFVQEEQQKAKEYTDQIWKQINQYIQEYAKENGYDYILGAKSDGTVMYANPSQDLTNEIIRYINEKYEGN